MNTVIGERSFWSKASCVVLALLASILALYLWKRISPGIAGIQPQLPEQIAWDTGTGFLILICIVGMRFAWRGSKIAIVAGLIGGLASLIAIAVGLMLFVMEGSQF